MKYKGPLGKKHLLSYNELDRRFFYDIASPKVGSHDVCYDKLNSSKEELTLTQTEQLQKIISDSKAIVFFGGAGVSTESGIPDFRSTDGLYSMQYKYPPETMVSHTFYAKHPEEFFEFYRKKLMFPDARPNKAHLKLAELEAAGKLKAVVTQNIDGLHQTAGSREVIELHGSVKRNFCQRCSASYDETFIRESTGVPVCSCGGRVKPDVVLYEEPLDQKIIQKAIFYISQADALIIGGTSLVVYPAAGLVDYYRGNKLVVINRTATSSDHKANLLIQGSIGEVLGQISAD